MVNKFVILGAASLLITAWAVPLEVGDDRPALANYTIDNVPPDYHGPWLDIKSYAGKGVVVVHWKAS